MLVHGLMSLVPHAVLLLRLFLPSVLQICSCHFLRLPLVLSVIYLCMYFIWMILFWLLEPLLRSWLQIFLLWYSHWNSDLVLSLKKKNPPLVTYMDLLCVFLKWVIRGLKRYAWNTSVFQPLLFGGMWAVKTLKLQMLLMRCKCSHSSVCIQCFPQAHILYLVFFFFLFFFAALDICYLNFWM